MGLKMIKRYAVILNGKIDNICLWDGVTPWTPEAGTEVVEAPDNVGSGWLVDGDGFVPPSLPPEPTIREVDSYRFLFQLHTVLQQIRLDSIRSAASVLTPTQISNFDPEAVDNNGYPLAVLRVVRLSYQQMERLGGKLDLLSQNMEVFLNAISSVGVYGETSEQITAEIARIKSDTLPDV